MTDVPHVASSKSCAASFIFILNVSPCHKTLIDDLGKLRARLRWFMRGYLFGRKEYIDNSLQRKKCLLNRAIKN